MQSFEQPLRAHNEELVKSNREPLLGRQDFNVIFGKLERIRETHSGICMQLRSMLNHWNERREIGAIWANRVSRSAPTVVHVEYI